MSPLVLSLFPGVGLLDLAFEEEWPEACIVRGPDLIFNSLSDVHRFHPPAGRFDGVIGGPPCQIFSILKRLNPKAGEKHGNLIPEFERCVSEARPAWFVMENVELAPVPTVPGYVTRSELVRDVEVGGLTSRERRISFGTPDGRRLRIERLALYPFPERAVLASAGGRRVPVAIGGSGKPKRRHPRHGPNEGPREPLSASLRAQGLRPDFLADCPLTLEGKRHAIGNGVPLPMGRAIARAVKRALEIP